MILKSIFPIVFLLATAPIFAQVESGSTYFGGYAGAAWQPNGIRKLPQTIISRSHEPTTYQTVEHPSFGLSAGLGICHRFANLEWLALQGEVNYAKKSGSFDYSDAQPLTYNMKFDYQFLSIIGTAKMFPVAGFYVRPGFYGGINISDKIKYQHAPEDKFGPSDPDQAELNRTMHGRSDLGFLFGVGYELPSGLTLDASAHFGTADVVEVDADNGYDFVTAPKNSILSVQLTVGYFFPLTSQN